MIDIITKLIMIGIAVAYAIAWTFIVLDFVTDKVKKISSKKINRVHFYVARDKNGSLWLYIDKPFRRDTYFYGYTLSINFKKIGLNKDDFKDLKWEDEPVEVYLNMDD